MLKVGDAVTVHGQYPGFIEKDHALHGTWTVSYLKGGVKYRDRVLKGSVKRRGTE